jgi:hypothetical protein
MHPGVLSAATFSILTGAAAGFAAARPTLADEPARDEARLQRRPCWKSSAATTW